MTPRWIPLAWLMAGLCACATVDNPVTGRAERSVMDERTEIAEGRKAHQEVLAEYGELRDERLQQYVREVGRRLAQHGYVCA